MAEDIYKEKDIELPADVDLGGGYRLVWCHSQGEIIGGTIFHPAPTPDKPDATCCAMFWIKRPPFSDGDNRPVWTFNNDFVKPTLNPSFVCHCGKSHGYVTDGVWKSC